MRMNAKEMIDATAGAYLLPTIGLKLFVISLFALFMYTLDVLEIRSRSGNSVCWNFDGMSLNSAIKSSSSPSSIQNGFGTFLLDPDLDSEVFDEPFFST